jgi:hypothetical protein
MLLPRGGDRLVVFGLTSNSSGAMLRDPKVYMKADLKRVQAHQVTLATR